ncbi:AT-hook motif nuclear-localized protein 7-like isoform X2 [Juglans microcarpa x Juglans regia]|uniref:AT-hook motif nuclear-localized protein 7-like isoform X2 n=1 Tax=Juglans microcarpa x Juglans regia TaxID=2249226 RepID=UPI001B7EBAD5|nr:AT-hook motif nuclear-localized protein 7-like isoform X2 [Juglans microcarpa x Juglans regia]
MEEKESSVSGPLGNSDTESPPALLSNVAPPQAVVNMAVDTSLGITTAPNTATTTITTATSMTPGSAEFLGKKKRGRPRKYDADGNLRQSYTVPPSPGFALSPSSPTPPSPFSSKRGRGRPPGSGNWQLLASLGELFANTAGGDFTPHVVTVNTGEDVAGKIISFAQKGPRGVCVLSANGAVSNVTIRQPGSSGGILTYEGRFEILSLSGSFTVTDNGGTRGRTGGLSISLAGPDGRVIGGGIAGLLMAAGPIQLVVGSFVPNGYKAHKRKHHREQTTMFPISSADSDMVTAAGPSQLAKPDDQTIFAPIQLQGQNNAKADNCRSDDKLKNPNGTLDSAGWNRSESTSDQRPSPDINVPASGE